METLRAKLLLLDVLRAARQHLVEKFIEEDPTLFRDVLRSRKGGEVADVLLERHFLLWHLTHFNLLDGISGSLDITESELRELTGQMASLIRELTEGSGANNSDFFRKMLADRAEILDGLVNVSEKSDKNINRLRYLSEKETFAIEKLMESLSQGSID